MLSNQWEVATALTVYGIETHLHKEILVIPAFRLQQPLPFTVLKQSRFDTKGFLLLVFVATALTVYGMRRRVRDGRGAKRR